MATIMRTPDVLPPAKPNHDYTRKPESRIGIFFWRWRMWVESTFVLSMLEPWEKILILTITAAMWLWLLSAILKYMPHHLAIMQRRAVYYLWGKEDDVRLVWQWLGFGNAEVGGASGLFKEL